jgi:Protein of unknown function (DUF1822)
MSIFHPQIQSLAQIYPEHIWIDIDPNSYSLSLNQVELNQLCIGAVTKYLTESQDLIVRSIFPSEASQLPFVSKLINGFALTIAGTKVVFIPSLDLDLIGFEVPREWVDLENWFADYYVPIRVDPEYNCLHLWGFISHQYLQQTANLDRNFCNYEVEGVNLIGDLDSLWIACDLVANAMTESERGEIPKLDLLSQIEVAILIDQLHQHRSIFSPRLVLPFEQWGAIINSPEYLAMYANLIPAITKISDWFRSQVTEIEDTGNTLLDRGWMTITALLNSQKPLSGYFAAPDPKTFIVGTIPLSNDREIDRAIKNLYENQDPTKKVDLPVNIDSPQSLLVHLIQYTSDEYLRWQAAEYLWTIAPDRHPNWHRRIKDLGLVLQGYQLGLMVAAIPLLNGTYAVLNRLYPIGSEDSLPPNIRLSLLAEDGNQLCEAISKSTVKDSYIQLYFTASIDDRFNVRVSTTDASITEAFAI